MKLSALFKTTTIRQSLITTTTTVINGVTATVFYLLAARVLEARDYGLFSLTTITTAVMTTVFDFGNDKGMVKFLAKYDRQSLRGRQMLKTIFLVKSASSIFFIAAFSLFPRQLALLVFNQPAMTPYMPFIAVAFCAQLLLFFVTYYFQAREKFIWWAASFIGVNTVRVVLALVLAATGRLDARNVILLFALTPFLGFALGLVNMGWDFIHARLEKSVLSELFGFNKWAFGFSSVSTVSSRLDTFLTSQLTSLNNVGVYGLATQATYIMPNLVSALGAVTAPKFSRFGDHQANKRYLVKASLFFGVIAVICGLVLVPLGYLFIAFSGPEYLAGFVPFLLLVTGQVIFLALSPLRDSILYYYSRPDFFFWTELGHGTITLVSGLILLPRWGLVGAGVSNLLGMLLLNSLSVWMYLRLKGRELII
jgi:O-antigen/teichoic acid export membrane protein